MRVSIAELGGHILGRSAAAGEPSANVRVAPKIENSQSADYHSIKQAERGRRSSVDRSIGDGSAIFYENPLRNVVKKAVKPVTTVIFKARQWWYQSAI